MCLAKDFESLRKNTESAAQESCWRCPWCRSTRFWHCMLYESWWKPLLGITGTRDNRLGNLWWNHSGWGALSSSMFGLKSTSYCYAEEFKGWSCGIRKSMFIISLVVHLHSCSHNLRAQSSCFLETLSWTSAVIQFRTKTVSVVANVIHLLLLVAPVGISLWSILLVVLRQQCLIRCYYSTEHDMFLTDAWNFSLVLIGVLLFSIRSEEIPGAIARVDRTSWS